MHSSIIEDYENRQEANFKKRTIKENVIFFVSFFLALVFIGIASYFCTILVKITIDIHNTFFISSLVFCLFSFLNIMYIVLYFKHCLFVYKDDYALLSIQYKFEIERLQINKISTEIVKEVVYELNNNMHIYIKNDDKPLTIVKNLTYEKENNESFCEINKSTSKLFYSFGTTAIGITISLLLANNMSREMFKFSVLLLFELILIFLAFAIIPNPIYKKRKCKKLAEKTELIMRLNEEIEIQERKILNKE